SIFLSTWFCERSLPSIQSCKLLADAIDTAPAAVERFTWYELRTTKVTWFMGTPLSEQPEKYYRKVLAKSQNQDSTIWWPNISNSWQAGQNTIPIAKSWKRSKRGSFRSFVERKYVTRK